MCLSIKKTGYSYARIIKYLLRLFKGSVKNMYSTIKVARLLYLIAHCAYKDQWKILVCTRFLKTPSSITEALYMINRTAANLQYTQTISMDELIWSISTMQWRAHIKVCDLFKICWSEFIIAISHGKTTHPLQTRIIIHTLIDAM